MSAYLQTELSLRKADAEAAEAAYRAAEDRVVETGRAVETVRLRMQEQARADPQPGDRWSEILSWWLYVVARDGDTITVQYAAAPCTFPQDATEETLPISEWRQKFRVPRLIDRGRDVAGWAGKAKERR